MKRITVLLMLCFVCPLVAPAQVSSTPEAATKGKVYFWMTLWPSRIVKFDPATDKVVGEISLENGLQFGVRLSWDKKRFLAITGQRTVVEVVDRAQMKVVDTHTFAKPGYIIRVDRVMECPGGTHWFVRVDKVKQAKDHYVIEEPEWWYYNLADKKVELVGPRLPKELRGSVQISPDGKNWHVFGRDLRILDGATREEIGRIDLHTPRYWGTGALRVRTDDFFDGKKPGKYRLMYSMQDPVQKSRRLAGLVDLDYVNLEIDRVIEWGADPGGFGMAVSKDHKWGYATKRLGGGRGRGGSSEDPDSKIVRYDLTTGQKAGEMFYRFRPRQRLAAASPDGEKFYIGGAGNDFQVFDKDFKFLKTVVFPGDLAGRIWSLED